MKDKYRRTKTTVTMINYHIIFCPRYRRKIFNIDGVEDKFKELVKLKCEEMNIEIIAIECNEDHTHIFLNCPPTISPADVIKKLKGCTGRQLRDEITELSQMPNLWTRSYFLSTAGEVSSETIKKYVENQKKYY